jgi:CMP-N-acetylneuraminic acid synthetase
LKPICFIGARGGSKGVLRKNIRKFGEKPLIAHTIESAIDSALFSHVVVSTEDPEITKISKQFGAEVPFLRPKKLSSDNSSMFDVLIHGINKLQSLGYSFDIIVNRDCTVPFIRHSDISNSIRILKKSKCDAVYGCYKQHLNPYFNMMEFDSNGFLKMCKKKGLRPKRRQDAPVVFQLNGFFTFNVKKLLKYKKLVMPKILPCEISPETGFMIDTEIEFKIAELLLKNKILEIN